MLKVLSKIKILAFLAPLLIGINLIAYTFKFLTAGLTTGEVIKGEYALMLLGFSVMFYSLQILTSMGNRVRKQIIDETTSLYIEGKLAGVEIEMLEAQVKQYIYDKYEPKKTKWVYKDVVNQIMDELEAPFVVLKKWRKENEKITINTYRKVSTKAKEAEGASRTNAGTTGDQVKENKIVHIATGAGKTQSVGGNTNANIKSPGV